MLWLFREKVQRFTCNDVKVHVDGKKCQLELIRSPLFPANYCQELERGVIEFTTYPVHKEKIKIKSILTSGT